MWRTVDEPPFIYWSAITLARDASAEQVADTRGTVCDSWSMLELEAFGFEVRAREPWFVRRPGPLSAASPAELEIVDVATPPQVREFEEVSARGFGGEGATVETPFHPPSILADMRMRMLIGRAAGEPVAAAMSYRSADAVGIFGVTTIEPARGRGYASALTAALVDPALPTMLSPSPEAESLYRRLGFEQVGELRQWGSRREQP